MPQGADIVEIVVHANHRRTQNSASAFDVLSSNSSASVGQGSGSSSGGGSQISPETMSALLDAQSQSSAGATTTASKSRSDALKDLFAQIDGDGDGKITKSEFEEALGAGGTNLRRPTACSASSTRTATARSASRSWRRR
jgi:hypothetical protein